MKKSKAQSTLEYVIILAAIIAAVIVGRTMIQSAVNKNLTDVQTSMQDATTRLPGVSSGTTP